MLEVHVNNVKSAVRLRNTIRMTRYRLYHISESYTVQDEGTEHAERMNFQIVIITCR